MHDVRNALDVLWKELERILTEEHHTACNVQARHDLHRVEWFFEDRVKRNAQ